MLDTTLDGGGTITLDGQDGDRLFVVSNGAVLTLRNIVLDHGFAVANGGAIHNGSAGADTPGAVILENSTIRNSTAGQSGGAIVSTGPLTITNSLLEGNSALNGGALYPRFAGARTTIINSTLRYNQATDTTNGWGGAMLIWDGASVTIEGSDLFNNTSRSGGGLYVYANSTLTLNGSTVRNNGSSLWLGGGIYNGGTSVLNNVILSGNSAEAGGGIENLNGTMTLTNVILSGNEARQIGGGLDNSSGTTTLTNVTLSGNAAKKGGGLYNRDVLTIIGSTISANAVTPDAIYKGEGGGIANDGYLAVLAVWNSTIDGNTSYGHGGGLYNSGTANLYNVTISHNVADYDDDGVGSGGGAYNAMGAPFNTRNTLLAVNYRGITPALHDCSGAIWSDHSRFTSIPAGCSIVGPSSFSTDPNGIGPLADNGGPTQTVALLPGSDAIDAADPVQGCVNNSSLLLTDQRGAPRSVGVRCDVGAFEFGALLPRLFLPLVIR
jgi:hypothetical protein